MCSRCCYLCLCAPSKQFQRTRSSTVGAVFLATSIDPDLDSTILAALPSEVEGFAVEPVVVNVCDKEVLFPLVLSQREVSEGKWTSLGDVNHPGIGL